MANVIVVPETKEFRLDVSHRNLVWVSKKLGIPKLKHRQANYLAPFWIGEDEGVSRLYHIVGAEDCPETTDLILGNSFVLPTKWTAAGQRRRFEYHPLTSFGFVEIKPGLLLFIC